MLFLATFFPTWEGGAGVYDFVGVSLKCCRSNSIRKGRKTPCQILLTVVTQSYLEGVCICFPGIHEGNSGPGGPVGSPSCDVS